jgi:alanyl-tRNA synthetase
LAPIIVSLYPSDLYPEIHERTAFIISLLQQEEQFFIRLMQNAHRTLGVELKTLKANGIHQLSADKVFEMYSSNGIPFDVIKALSEEQGILADIEGALLLLEDHKLVSGSETLGSLKSSPTFDAPSSNSKVHFVGYDTLETEAEIVRILPMVEGKELNLVLSPCPLYALGGGQAGDAGFLGIPSLRRSGELHWVPCKAVSMQEDGVMVSLAADNLSEIQSLHRVSIKVDLPHRNQIASHHSATHLLHHSLRHTLGDHITQAGSNVTSEKLTFDFTHGKALTVAQLTEIQDMVNQLSLSDASTTVREVSLAEAKQEGALMHFAETYGTQVRMVNVGPSTELCCGTHVASTRLIYPFLITGEKSVAAGTRRIEAVSGNAAWAEISQFQHHFREIGDALGQSGKSFTPNFTEMVARITQLRLELKQIQRDQTQLIDHLGSHHLGQVHEIGCFTVQLVDPQLPLAYFKRRVGHLRKNATQPAILLWKTEVAVIGCATSEFDARNIVDALVSIFEGSGGGSSGLAMGKLGRSPSEAEWCRAIADMEVGSVPSEP